MKRINRMLGFATVLVLMLGSLLTACAAPPAASTQAPAEGAQPAIKDKELNVLCTPQEEWCAGMKVEFEKKYGITVNYIRMSAGEALARLQAEKDNPSFDVWWGGPVDSFIAAKQVGILEPYNSPSY